MTTRLADAADIVQSVWGAAGGPAGRVLLEACPVSGNNRVFTAQAGGQQVIAKFYFPTRDGEIDRLDAEWGFLTHSLGAGVHCVPQPLARDVGARVALYEFIKGRKLASAEIGAAEVSAAARFIAAINDPSAAVSAAQLPKAREACFSIADHLAVVDRRIDRLAQIPRAMELDAAAAALADQIGTFWLAVRARLIKGAEDFGLDPTAAIPAQERLLSPSDFGFHNALARPDGRLAFIDFEYAGWDDVAKLAADFFYQPAVPVDQGLSEDFLGPILAAMDDQDRVRRRIALLRPIFGLKWCCIMLNRFLPDMVQRSEFAEPLQDAAPRKREQLEKAKNAFDNLVNEKWLM